MKKSIKLFITGTVQGVFFRDFVGESAKKLKLRGYVRNLDDGRMEVRIEGEGKDVEEMVELFKMNPKIKNAFISGFAYLAGENNFDKNKI